MLLVFVAVVAVVELPMKRFVLFVFHKELAPNTNHTTAVVYHFHSLFKFNTLLVGATEGPLVPFSTPPAAPKDPNAPNVAVFSL